MNVSTQLKERVNIEALQVDIGGGQTLAHTVVVEIKIPVLRHLHPNLLILPQKA